MKLPSWSGWALWYTSMTTILAVLVLGLTGVYDLTDGWYWSLVVAYWVVFGGYIVWSVAGYLRDRKRDRDWRRTDSRTTEGQRRAPGWAEDDSYGG